MAWEYNGNSLGNLRKCYGITVYLLCLIDETAVGIFLGLRAWEYYGKTLGVFWKHTGNTPGTLWEYSGNTALENELSENTAAISDLLE